MADDHDTTDPLAVPPDPYAPPPGSVAESADAPQTPSFGDLVDDPEHRAKLARTTMQARQITGKMISPKAVAVAAYLANMITDLDDKLVPQATLFTVCELACKLENADVTTIAAALVTVVQETAKAHRRKPKFR